jgi:hypothetical protein
MSWYNPASWFNSLAGNSASPTNYASQKRSFFSINGAKEIYFNLNCEDDYRSAYLVCSPLKAIVNKRAQMFVNGIVEVRNRNSNNPQRGAKAKLLRDLFKKPNAVQSWTQFFAQMHIYIDLFGYCPVLKITPVGMPDVIRGLWCLPPWLFDVEFNAVNLQSITKLSDVYKDFYFQWNNQKKALDRESVCIVLDNSIGTDDDMNLLIPDSRVRSMEYNISNILASYKSRNTLITKKGAIGILSNYAKDASGPVPLDKDEKKAVQDDFARYGLTGQEWQVIVTDASLEWQAMTFPTKDLMLFEEVEDNIQRLSDGMGFYFDLIAKLKGSTFANLNEAKKAQYQDHIIPDACARLEQLSEFLLGNENAYLHISYDHVEVLQQSAKEKADAQLVTNQAYQILYEAGLCTKNQWLLASGLDPIAAEVGDKYIYEIDNTPLAVKLGVGGTQALQLTLAAMMPAETKKNVLIYVFGIAPEVAELLKGKDPEPPKPIGIGNDKGNKDA